MSCAFKATSPCQGPTTPEGFCLRHRSLFASPGWELVDELRAELIRVKVQRNDYRKVMVEIVSDKPTVETLIERLRQALLPKEV